MRTVGSALLALVIAAGAAAPAARAQMANVPQAPHQHRLRLGLGGGVDVPTSHSEHVFKNGVHGQGFLLVNLGFLPQLRFDLGYSKFDLKDEVSGGATGSGRLLSGIAGLKLNLLHGPVRPYLLAGLGAFNLKNTVDGASASTTKFGIDGGAGLSFSLGRIDAFLEGRVQNVYTDQGVIDTKSIRTVPVTFGIIF